ncbi:MAG: DNA-binding domain-containing protein [Methylohalobius sp. ZOD2]|nr:putative DNA-binding domain-containing protein [Methylothermaceae bacterium]
MTLPDLATVQRRLRNAVMGREDKPPFLTGAGAGERLAVYRNAYRVRLTEALAVDYPMLARWLGEARFAQLAEDYIANYPSDVRSIRWVGRHLTKFLRAAEPWRERPELAEMAAFEWALGLAFDCADADPLAPEALVRIPPEQWPRLRFQLHPSVQLLQLAYSVPSIWKALQAESELPPYRPNRVSWLIWRQGLRQFFRSLAEPEAHALRAIQTGHPLAEVCAELARWDCCPDAAQEAARLLRQWLAAGVIVALKVT